MPGPEQIMSAAQTTLHSSLQIREPRESEYPAYRILLPDVVDNPTNRIFRLAVDSAKPSIVGALCYYDDSQALTRVRLHVVKPRRRSGIGSLLLAYTLDEARRLGRGRVLVDADIKKELDADPFLTARGFRRIGSRTSVRGPLMRNSPKAALFREQVARAAEFPPDARLVNISEAPADQILKLYAEHIANVPELPGMPPFQPDQYGESLVLMIGDQVIAFLLAQVEGRTARVPAAVVIPAYRGRGITHRLGYMLEERLGDSVDQGEFEYADSATFTAKLAAEFGYEVLRIAARFERTL